MAGDCFKINDRDNVATMLVSSQGGPALVRNRADTNEITLIEPIEIGHKVALETIQAGAEIIKFGTPIGRASKAIAKGAWIHLHNCESQFDERSGSLDIHSGATTDTRYE